VKVIHTTCKNWYKRFRKKDFNLFLKMKNILKISKRLQHLLHQNSTKTEDGLVVSH